MSTDINWGGSDLFTHMLVVGATRSGKTATILKPIIYQLMLAKKRGVPLGISVVEPKGDVAQMLADLAEEMDMPYTHIDPLQPEISGKFNPMEGEINSVAEATVIVLKGLFGKQDAFFATVQELSARNVVKLLKENHGDNMDIMDVLVALRDPVVLKQEVALLEQKGNSDLVDFFKSELLGSMADKYRQFVIGLRAQLENIVSNKNLRDIITGKSSFNMDEHFEKGGLLAVNTALGMLRSSGDAFGQFITMHLQNATFRRPPTEDDTVVPHFMIVDEYSRYINPDVEIFLSLAATYKVSGIFAVQSLSQLELESGKYSAKAMRQSILTNTRNKIVFGGVAMDDAKAFSEMFGEDDVVMRQSTYKFKTVMPMLFPDSYRDTETTEVRFSPTDIMDQLPRFTYVHQMMKDGKLNEPGLGLGQFVPRNWKELREWEDKPLIKKSNYLNGIKEFFTKNKKLSEAEEAEKLKSHLDHLEDDLSEETEKEVITFAQIEKEAEANYKQEGQRYRDELAKEGLTERDLMFLEAELGKGVANEPEQTNDPFFEGSTISASNTSNKHDSNEVNLTEKEDTASISTKEETIEKPEKEETNIDEVEDLLPLGDTTTTSPIQEEIPKVEERSDNVEDDTEEDLEEKSFANDEIDDMFNTMLEDNKPNNKPINKDDSSKESKKKEEKKEPVLTGAISNNLINHDNQDGFWDKSDG